MLLYLSSYKLGNRTGILKDWIKNNGRDIVLIPNAKDKKEQNDELKNKIQENVKMLEEIGFRAEILSLKEYFGRQDKLRKKLENYHAFCAIGGNVFALRQAMKLSGFDKYLKEISKNEDYLYIGYSAGACVLSPTLRGFEVIDEPINPYNDDDVIYDGLSLINYMFVPHYKSNHKESDNIDKLVMSLKKYKVNYEALRDGEVILKELMNNDFLEKCLPKYLENDLNNLKEGIKNNSRYLDCLIDELQGSINSAFVDGRITEEQCDYLYEKYIRGTI